MEVDAASADSGPLFFAHSEADAASLTVEEIRELIGLGRHLTQLVNRASRIIDIQKRVVGNQDRLITMLDAERLRHSTPRPRGKPGRKAVTAVPVYARAAKAIRTVVLARGWQDEKMIVKAAAEMVGERFMAKDADRTTAYQGVKRAWARERLAMEEESKQMRNRLAALLTQPPKR